MDTFFRVVTRRQFAMGAGAAFAGAMLAGIEGTGPATAVAGREAGAAAPVQLVLPPPTGPYPVGTVSLHLIDRTRQDTWITPNRVRELMVSLWYPAGRTRGYPRVPWLPPAAAAHFAEVNGAPQAVVRQPVTHGRDGAPVHRAAGRLPVLVFSPGSYADRSSNTLMVEELASRGYLVVTVDHTHDASEVEFPGGRLETATMPRDTPGADQVVVRAADVRFVLDQLTVLHAGGNPDAGRRRLPTGLCGALDLNRVGMFGTSMGGATTATAMLTDRRIAAGLILDGPVRGAVATAGLDRPVLLLEATIRRVSDPKLASFWANLTGWRRDLFVHGAGHLSYSDMQVLLPQVAGVIDVPPGVIGDIDPARAVAVQRSYPAAFFDLHLRGHGSRLLDGPSPWFPEVEFVD